MKITYGLKKLAYAKITIGEAGKVTFAKPVMIPGARAISLKPLGEDKPVYADDIKYVTLTANQGYDGDFTVLGLPETFLTDIFGMKKNSAGVLVENTDDSKSAFALLGELASETAEKKRFVFYNCEAGRAEITSKSKEDSTEPNEVKVSMKASPAVDTGNVKATVVGGKEANTVFDGWYNAVYVEEEA